MLNGILFDMADTLVKLVYSPLAKGQVVYIPLPGIPAMLERIKPHFKLAIVSNTLTWKREDLQLRLGGTGILHYFDYIVTSVDVGAAKPLSPIFKDALDNLGLATNEVVMVGDRLDTDILGAKQLGIKAILLDWETRQQETTSPDNAPDLIVRSAEELKVALLALRDRK